MTHPPPKTKSRKPPGSLAIVVNGPMRLLKSKWYKERRATLELELRQRYAKELDSADWWTRKATETKIQRELGKLCSPYSLWSSC